MNIHNSNYVPGVTVYYDGECPICKLEVDLYQKFSSAKTLHWIDITTLNDDELPVGKDRQTLLNRFHVLDTQGNWHIGVDAFACIWRQLPGFRHFAFLFAVPGIRQIAEVFYRLFLRWQAWHRTKRQHKA